MIPTEIHREHILAALAEIDRDGVRYHREAVRHLLHYRGKTYPPKYVVSLAGRLAMGREVDPKDFSGGEETNAFLRGSGFEIRSEKSEEWSQDECYMAVWGYDQLDIDRRQIKALLFRDIAARIGRTSKSVEYKIQNVSHFDPRNRSQKPIAPAKNAQKLLGEVFNQYWTDRDAARSRYPTIWERFQFGYDTDLPKQPGAGAALNLEMIIEEGAEGYQHSKRRKRSNQLLEAARKHFRGLESDGRMRCQACGLKKPMEMDGELIQLHHQEPIAATALDGRRMTLRDAIAKLIPLCPTCHTLAHTQRPPLIIAEIRRLAALSRQTPTVKSPHSGWP